MSLYASYGRTTLIRYRSHEFVFRKLLQVNVQNELKDESELNLFLNLGRRISSVTVVSVLTTRQFEWPVCVSALHIPAGMGRRWIYGASTLSYVK